MSDEQEKCQGGHLGGEWSQCNNPPKEPHQCPFEQEIHGNDDFLCNCCPECETQCRYDI